MAYHLCQNKILNKPFKQIFHITDIKHNIIGIPFISKYIPTINILNGKILIKDKYTKTKNTALTSFQRLNKQPPFSSKFYPIYNQQRKHLKPLSGNIYNFSIKQVHQYDKSQNKQQLFISDFEFKPIHKFFQNHDLIYKIFEKTRIPTSFRYTCITIHRIK